MRKVLAFTVAVALAGFSLSAQQTRTVKPHQKQIRMQQGHHREMLKDLNLTDAQKAQLKTDKAEAKAKMDALEKQDNLTVKEMRQRKAALQQEQKAKMEVLLTAEQKAKIAAGKTDILAKRKNMDGNRGEAMQEKLGITNEQAAKLKAHNEATHDKIQEIQENQNLTMDQRKTQIKAVKDASKAERKNILTAEQIQRMDEMRKEGKNRKGNKTPGRKIVK